MKKIPLTKGRVTVVDDEDYELYSKSKLCLIKNKYAVISSTKKYLHRLIMNCPDRMQIDHINRDTLDNRRKNLRICTSKQNSYNRNIQSNNKTGYTGVIWHKEAKKWRAQIKVDQKFISIGYFENILDAAKAYNKVSIEYFGEYARLNTL